jgi:hypothetical protein
MRRRLKIAWTVFFAVLTVALCVLWVRSYWRYDGMACYENEYEVTTLGSNRGAVSFIKTTLSPRRNPNVTAPRNNTGKRGWYRFSVASTPSPMLRLALSDGITKIYIPHLFAILLVAAIASAPWLPFRFSLRTLLIVTTLISVALGIAAYSTR